MQPSYHLASSLLFVTVMFGGCSTTVEHTHETYIVQPNVTPTPANQAQPASAVEAPQASETQAATSDSDNIDWIHGKIQASGQSALNRKFAANPGQARLMAQRGAVIDAKRNLLERVLGLKLDVKSSVRDMVADEDDMRAETSGLIRHCYVLGEHYHPATGIYSVTMELPLHEVRLYLREKRSE